MTSEKLSDRRYDHDHAVGARGDNPQRPLRAAARLGRFRDGLLRPLEHPDHALVQIPAGLGEFYSARSPHEEARPEFSFKPGDLLADDGFGDTKPLGGPGERMRLRYCHEIDQSTQDP